ncbi:MAG: MBL fold metallo-hydrolase [Verrucomicrobiales bacterium]|nr:MBL fold metallo-hydrolase [Verrucomicrobiales bacterium]
MLRITVLGSGSSGNCALVVGERVRFLIDAGLSSKQICLRLGQVGVDPGSLDGILLTHEHGDHVRGLDVFCKRHEVPVVCTPMTREVLQRSLKVPKQWKLVPSGGDFELMGLSAATFPVPHDAVDPVGIVLRDGESGLGVVSDVGYVTNLMRERLRGLETIFVEANYDEKLLEEDTKRPWSTKQRISARHGHLSNVQTAELVASVAGPHLNRVILGHLSDDCNCPVLAREMILEVLGEKDCGHVDVCCAGRVEPTELWEAAPRRERPVVGADGERVQAELL